MEIKNARIESTSLGTEDHGIMTYTLYLDYGGSCQGFGGFALDDPPLKGKKDRIGVAYGIESVMRILRVVGVEKWEDLPGRYIRVKSKEGGGWNSEISSIGNILEDEWFDPKELAEELGIK